MLFVIKFRMSREFRVLVRTGLRTVVSLHTLHLICIIMSLEPGLRPTLKWERETSLREGFPPCGPEDRFRGILPVLLCGFTTVWVQGVHPPELNPVQMSL